VLPQAEIQPTDPEQSYDRRMTVRSASFLRNQELKTLASRERILDSAVQCLIEHGYAGASTLRIQQVAGVSRGRLLHHFPSRDELLVGAVKYLASTGLGSFAVEGAPAITAADRDESRIDEAVTAMWMHFQQPYFWASVELWIAARHNESLRAALGPAEDELASSVRVALDALFGTYFVAHPNYRMMTNVLVSSMRGASLATTFSMRRSSDRNRQLHEWHSTARVLLGVPVEPTVSLDSPL
jgi:AcrR family transcriptional regulator